MIRISGGGENGGIPSASASGDDNNARMKETSDMRQNLPVPPASRNQSIPTSPKRKNKKNKLDFRFADEEDVEDIVDLVNRAFSIEIGDSGVAFRNCNKITPQKAASYMNSGGSTNWVVLETQPPDEAVVAAALIRIDSYVHEGHVEYLAIHPAVQRRGIGRYLMYKVENIFSNFACKDCVLQISQWRDDVQAWLKKLGYKEMGGGFWPEDQQASLTRPTMYLLYKKTLITPSYSTSSARVKERSKGQPKTHEVGSNSSTDFLNDAVLRESAQTNSSKSLEATSEKAKHSDGSLEDLLASLLSTLHTPEGRKELNKLSKQQQLEDENT